PIDKTLPRVEVLFRIHYATNGIIANVMNLMRKAAENAYTRNSPTIDLADLSYAFTKRVGKHLYTKTNPFLTGADTSFTPPAETLAPKNDAKSKYRGRGKKPPTASQVLTT
ncbi:MAG: hypothetical protein JW862_16940, partial [Anaerolineales bacterium]|nr:hypothetical protein [Anaerolineales bacterium]